MIISAQEQLFKAISAAMISLTKDQFTAGWDMLTEQRHCSTGWQQRRKRGSFLFASAPTFSVGKERRSLAESVQMSVLGGFRSSQHKAKFAFWVPKVNNRISGRKKRWEDSGVGRKEVRFRAALDRLFLQCGPQAMTKISEPKDSRAMFSHRVKWEEQVTKQNESD